MSEKSKIPFIPITAVEDQIHAREYQAGNLYFATDSGRIYLDMTNERLAFGGNGAAVLYSYAEVIENDNDTYSIMRTSLADSRVEPRVDDLIINSDGRFFKVLQFNRITGEIVCQLLAVSGVGGGPGGAVVGSKPVINDLQKNNKYFSIDNTDVMKISFYASSLSTTNNHIKQVKIVYHNADLDVIEGPFPFDEEIQINLSAYLDKFAANIANTISISIIDAYGQVSLSENFTFYIVNAVLETSIDPILSVNANQTNAFNYLFTPKGGNINTPGVTIERFVELTVAPINDQFNIIFTGRKSFTSLNAELPLGVDFSEFNWNTVETKHGTYLMTATYYITIPDLDVVLSSNTLSHQLIYMEEGNNTPLLATDFVTQTIEQYSAVEIQYMIAQGSLEQPIEVQIFIEDTPEKVNATLNVINEWKYTFNQDGEYSIKIVYGNAINQLLGKVIVRQYSQEAIPQPIEGAELELTPHGKNNNQVNKNEWTWYDNTNKKTYAAQFDNFLWGNENGWITEEDGTPALKLTNGAKLTIPNYEPFAIDGTGTGLTIEIDFKLDKIMDFNQPLITCISPEFAEDGSINRYRTGIHINGSRATLNSQNYKPTTEALNGEEQEGGGVSDKDMALSSLIQYFNEDTRIHLTYVIEKKVNEEVNYIYTYVNGVLSGITKMDSNEAFLQNDMEGAKAIFTFDSTYADIYIYSIRTYRQGLTSFNAINNYIADISNIDKKIHLTKHNSVFNLNNKVSKKVIDNMALSLGVPYVVFEGGMKMPKKFKNKDLKDVGYKFSTDDLNKKLPVAKDDYRIMSMKMYEKDSRGNITTLMDVPMELGTDPDFNNKVTKPEDVVSDQAYWFNRGVQVYGQGTSSMVYPTKNLRLKFINSSDRPSVGNTEPLEIICFKADFMDSSSSHNTCTGNLVYDLYASMLMQTPPQAFNTKYKGEYEILTAILGYPIICFFKDYNNEDDDEDYIYIGRYNFNIDKATPEPFGFEGRFKYTNEVVSDSQGRIRKVVDACGLRTELINGKTVLPLDDKDEEIEETITQCWEFLNNDAVTPVKFLTPNGFTTFDDAMRNDWTKFFEDRYPDEIVGYIEDYGSFEDDGSPTVSEEEKAWADAALENGLFRMTSWVNSTAIEEVTNRVFDEPIYYTTLDKSYDANITYYDNNYNPVIVTSEEVLKLETHSDDESFKNTYVIINEALFKEKIKEELNQDNSVGEYSFSYIPEDNAWYFFNNNVSINLEDYGLSLNDGVTPQDGWSIIIAVTINHSGWNGNLLEKHTIDNERYRLAKFKNEFTQYFNLNYSLFYYVLTLVLLMMDSRAKNMMMASWDQQIWYPIFYDMDTMLGLNNTGFNKFTYDTEDDPKDKVFNGYDSVLWNNFKTCFYDEIALFYNQMREKMTLNKLLETYNEKGADAWNEALTTQDAIYKYERPYEEGYIDGSGGGSGAMVPPKTVSYLYAAQGRRSLHRAWWLKHRLDYLDSKYKPTILGSQKPSAIDTFSFRMYALPEQKSNARAEACIAAVPVNHKFDITALTNSYQSLFIGTTVYGPEYTSANNKVTLGPEDPRHEVEAWILNAPLIADVGDLSDKYLGGWSMANSKLTRLSFGRSVRSHPNNYDKYYNANLTTLTVGENSPYLSYLNVARCTGLPSLDLSECYKLRTLDAAHCSGLTNVVFPRDSILESIYIPKSLTNIEIHNQPYLTTLEFDDKESVRLSMSSVILDNVTNFDAYHLVSNIFANKANSIQYYLTGINWVIDDLEGIVTEIPFLEELRKPNSHLKPTAYQNLASSFTGTITLVGNITVDEYAIYEKYKQTFPNLTIEYGEGVNLTEAISLTFLKDKDSSEVHYKVLASNLNNDKSISYLISSNGPNGVNITDPIKASTLGADYQFTGYWIDASGKKYHNNISNPAAGTINFNDIIPNNTNSRMVFYPEFEANIKQYTVTFKDADDNIIQQNGQDYFLVNHGEIYNGPIKNYYYKNPSDLRDNERYAFIGWTIIRNPIKIEPINIEQYKVEANVTFYANFKIEDVYTTASSYDYFTIQDSGLPTASISIKEQYRDQLQGKITIPDVDRQKNPIYYVKDFTNAANITHIYFKNPDTAAYTTIQEKAFMSCTKLKVVELPNKITHLETGAFQGSRDLQTINLDNITYIGQTAFYSCPALRLIELPSKLEYIGKQAFYLCSATNIQFTSLPQSLRTIGEKAFKNLRNVKITEFGGDSNEYKLTSIGPEAFSMTSSSGAHGEIESINLYSSVTNIGDDAFKGYGAFGDQGVTAYYTDGMQIQNPQGILVDITTIEPSTKGLDKFKNRAEGIV